jgi:peptidoglycan/LPS O-acetylase OafA/YrhL
VTTPTTRLPSLDGLRGVASVVVLVHHAFLLIPWASDVYLLARQPTGIGWWLTYTPMHLGWAGTEAVYLFFVLSGLVLTFPVLRGAVDWGRYYPSRIVRLYLPVAGAVVFAALTGLFFARDAVIGSGWIQNHPPSYGLSQMISDATLIGGISNTITPLWSLVWEVFFSLLLPVYIAIAHRTRPWIVVVVSLALIAAGAAVGSQLLIHLPMFAIGVALAYGWSGLSARAAVVNASRWSWLFWLAAAAASVLMATSRWLLIPVNPVLAGYTTPLVVVGVAGFVIVAAFSPLARAVLSLRAVVWLGAVSFSLYLTHEPLLLAMAHFFPTSPKLAGAVGILVALPLAWLFHRLVERPTHRLAQRLAGRPPIVEERVSQSA